MFINGFMYSKLIIKEVSFHNTKSAFIYGYNVYFTFIFKQMKISNFYTIRERSVNSS